MEFECNGELDDKAVVAAEDTAAVVDAGEERCASDDENGVDVTGEDDPGAVPVPAPGVASPTPPVVDVEEDVVGSEACSIFSQSSIRTIPFL